MTIPEHVIQNIRDRVSISDVVGTHVVLKRAGRNLKGLCPFHPEKTPSFVVNEERGTFKCFGCGKGGNAFTFIMEMEGKTFPEAAEALAARAGIEIPAADDSPAARAERSDRAKIFEILTLASRYYRQQFEKGRAGEKAREYAEKRGIGEAAAETFSIGAAPRGRDHLARYLESKGVDPRLSERAGIIIRSETGGYYDRFRDRLIFPITDPMGRVVSFGGRILETGEPKYLNGPETEVFQKGRILYGLFQGSEVLRKDNRAILVEGYMDVVMLHEKGFPGCLATLGTALTREHVEALRRRVDEAVLVYDGDEAGRKAMERSLPIFLEEGFPVKAVLLPDGEDPDTFAGKGGDLAALAGEAPWLFDAVMERIAGRHDLESVSGRLAAVDDAAGLLSGVSMLKGGREYARRAAEVLKVEEELFAARLGEPQRRTVRETEKAMAVDEPFDPRERELLKILLHRPDARRSFRADGGEKWFSSRLLREAAIFAVSRPEEPASFPVESAGVSVRDIMAALLTEEVLSDDYRLITGALEKMRLKRMADDLLRRIKEAEAKGDWEEWKRLVDEKTGIDRETRA